MWHSLIIFFSPFEELLFVAQRTLYDHQAQPFEIQGYLNMKLKSCFFFFFLLANNCQTPSVACRKRVSLSNASILYPGWWSQSSQLGCDGSCGTAVPREVLQKSLPFLRSYVRGINLLAYIKCGEIPVALGGPDDNWVCSCCAGHWEFSLGVFVRAKCFFICC